MQLIQCLLIKLQKLNKIEQKAEICNKYDGHFVQFLVDYVPIYSYKETIALIYDKIAN